MENKLETNFICKVTNFIFLGSKITADGDFSHEIQRCLLLGRKAMAYLLLFSHSVMSDSLWPHGLQHTRLPYPSPSPRACSNWCPSSQGCHPTISSFVIPFSSCLQSFPASGSFLMSHLFPLDGQSIGASVSASVLPMNIQVWFSKDWLVWSSCCPRDSQESSLTVQLESINYLALSFLYGPTLTSIHDYWKNHSFD